MSMSSGSITSSMPTIDDTDTLPSLTPPSTPMCEWQSMMPGMTYLPAASITVAPLGTETLRPTSAILPLRIRIEPLSIVPCETVRIVAF